MGVALHPNHHLRAHLQINLVVAGFVLVHARHDVTQVQTACQKRVDVSSTHVSDERSGFHFAVLKHGQQLAAHVCGQPGCL